MLNNQGILPLVKNIYTDPSVANNLINKGNPIYGNIKKYLKEKVDNWNEPKYAIADNTNRNGYDALSQTIYYDPKSEWENINNPAWLEHERYHHFQNISGRSHIGAPMNRPMEGASSEEINQYYNRRNTDLDNEVAAMIKKNPSLQFIPKDKLIQGSKSFHGAEDRIYANPTTEEGEARLYEDYISGNNKSIFPPLDIKSMINNKTLLKKNK